MTLTQFITTYTGQAVSYDGIEANAGQCEQLVQVYQTEVQNLPVFVTPIAVNYWNLFSGSPLQPNYNQIVFDGQSPNVGDIVVFGANSDINSPVAGHIDICIGSSVGGFLGFDSNWGNVNNAQGQPVAHQVNHSFTDVLGYLRPKEVNVETFNQGDAQNFSESVFGELNIPAFVSAQIGQDWKTAIYAIIADPNMQQFVKVNEGDQTNIFKALGATGNLPNLIDQPWKSVAYNYILTNIPTDTSTVLAPGNYKVE